jgi:hypothetical protein
MANVYKINWKSKQKEGTSFCMGKNPDSTRRTFYEIRNNKGLLQNRQIPPTARIKQIRKSS